MAKERIINTKFWNDNWVRDSLNPLDRYFFLYLVSNERTNISGIYELPLSTMSFETGIEKEELVKTMIPKLSPKVFYKDGWVILINFPKHQHYNNDSVVSGMIRELNLVPESVLLYAKKMKYGDSIGKVGGRGGVDEPSCHILNLTKLNLIVDKPQPFSLADKLKEMQESPKNLDRIISFFWKKKGFNFENSKQLSARYTRDCKPAKKLIDSGYSTEQIEKTFNYVAEKYKDVDYTIETIIKSLAEANK